ncbi:MAG: helix-turn-helix transcriptional regulator [Chloroflexi bacterium]|nr:helix-turn-helix transcriptional regulator [Chloroflexota bacterium]
MKTGSKYHALFTHLQKCTQDEVTLSFAEIEALLDANLPDSARRMRGWWGNRSRGGVQAAAWMGAGYHVAALDMKGELVTFAKPTLVYTVERIGDTVLWNGELVKGLRRHLGLTQGKLADELGVWQQTVSEWERGIYTPSRATSKYLNLVAERAGFEYEIKATESETKE